MTTSLQALQTHLTDLLSPGQFSDYCPNGLQVEGRESIGRVATGVTASQALIDEAILWGADAVIVHHGYFWKGEDPTVVGMKRRRLGALLANDVSLLAYHLPLDAHPELGNNACLGKLMGVNHAAPLDSDSAQGLVWCGALPGTMSAGDFVGQLASLTQRTPLHIGSASDDVHRIAWCTGAAQGYIEAAVAAGADMFVSGEISEQTVHIAREEGIHYVAAGHHATERYGVQALGENLAESLGVEHRFIDIENPV